MSVQDLKLIFLEMNQSVEKRQVGKRERDKRQKEYTQVIFCSHSKDCRMCADKIDRDLLPLRKFLRLFKDIGKDIEYRKDSRNKTPHFLSLCQSRRHCLCRGGDLMFSSGLWDDTGHRQPRSKKS